MTVIPMIKGNNIIIMGNKIQNTHGGQPKGWVDISKAHTEFSNPISEDGFWVSSVESSCCKVCPGFHPGGDSISNMGLKPILYFLASLEPAQCRGCQHLGAR